MKLHPRRTLLLAIATALVVAAPAWGAANIGLTVESATSDAITYRVASPQPGEYVARFSTSLQGSGPRAVFRFSDHDAQGRHTWNGRFKSGNRGLKLCLGPVERRAARAGAILGPGLLPGALSPRKTLQAPRGGREGEGEAAQGRFRTVDPAGGGQVRARDAHDQQEPEGEGASAPARPPAA